MNEKRGGRKDRKTKGERCRQVKKRQKKIK